MLASSNVSLHYADVQGDTTYNLSHADVQGDATYNLSHNTVKGDATYDLGAPPAAEAPYALGKPLPSAAERASAAVVVAAG